jgi:hypothetical protein
MKIYFSTLLLSLLFFSCNKKKQTGFADEIKTTKTAAHQNIPGSRVFIVAPVSFRPSSSLPAFESEKGLIQAMDLVGGNFYKNAATYSKEKFESSGIKVVEYRELKVNGYPAKYAHIQNDPQTSVYNLVFGDSSFSTMIIGTHAADDKKTGQQIRDAMLSVFYDKNFTIDPFASATFNLDDSRSIFKFARYAASMYMYSIDGKSSDNDTSGVFFMVMSLPHENSALKENADRVLNKMDEVVVKKEAAGTVNGFKSYKREVYGKAKGEFGFIYQHLVVIDENVVIMQGFAKNNFEKYITEFEKLSNSISRKK